MSQFLYLFHISEIAGLPSAKWSKYPSCRRYRIRPYGVCPCIRCPTVPITGCPGRYRTD